ncbi:unnamed protein product [Closterium sp. NIES-64]|nr:unnamed protein product [Closterium sp. NIES-64]
MTQEDASQGADGVQIPKEGTLTYDGRYRRYSFYGIIFEVPVRYVPLVPIGRGAYGIVCSARDETTGEEVAIKKIGKAFNDRTDAKRTLREIVLLRNMNHPNVIAIKDIIRPPNPQSFQDVYIVYELMPTDLHEVIRSGQAMDERHYKFILFQLLRGTKYIHSANILHRDLKPPNILIDARCNIKITDFGLARTRVETTDHLTEYVVTRYYRAPELLVNNQQYSASIDVWSVALIYLELVLGHIVLKGDNYVDQLRKTCELIGSPSAEDASFIVNDAARTFLLSELQGFPARNIRDVFPKLSEPAADLVQRMLVFDPRKRITVFTPSYLGSPSPPFAHASFPTTVDEALTHPYLAHYHRGRLTTTGGGSLPQGAAHYHREQLTTTGSSSLPQGAAHYHREQLTTTGSSSLPQGAAHYHREQLTNTWPTSTRHIPSPPCVIPYLPPACSPTAALAHPYLAHYHKANQDPPHPNPFQYDLSFEQEEYDIPRIRQLIFEQACAFNPQ